MTKIRLATRKHRVGLARIIAVIANAHTVEPTITDRGERAMFYQGFDGRGREIEVIVVEGEDYDLVIHALPLYRKRE